LLNNQQENANSPISAKKIQNVNNIELGQKIQKAYDSMVTSHTAANKSNISMQNTGDQIGQSFSRETGYMRWNTD
jgi:hypothetical protein